jgi:hypothetical protein
MGAPVLQKKNFSLLLATNISLPSKAKFIHRMFALFRFQKFFVSLPIFSLRFKAQQNKRFFTLFHFEVK